MVDYLRFCASFFITAFLICITILVLHFKEFEVRFQVLLRCPFELFTLRVVSRNDNFNTQHPKILYHAIVVESDQSVDSLVGIICGSRTRVKRPGCYKSIISVTFRSRRNFFFSPFHIIFFNNANDLSRNQMTKTLFAKYKKKRQTMSL